MLKQRKDLLSLFISFSTNNFNSSRSRCSFLNLPSVKLDLSLFGIVFESNFCLNIFSTVTTLIKEKVTGLFLNIKIFIFKILPSFPQLYQLFLRLD